MAHHHEVTYPESFPGPCIQSAINIFRNGTIAAERKTLSLDVYNIAGFGARVIIGVPDEPSALFSEMPGADEQCRELCAAASASLGQFHGEDFGARDWKAALKWFIENILPLLLPLILNDQT